MKSFKGNPKKTVDSPQIIRDQLYSFQSKSRKREGISASFKEVTHKSKSPSNRKASNTPVCTFFIPNVQAESI